MEKESRAFIYSSEFWKATPFARFNALLLSTLLTNSWSVGASGAIFGLFGCYLLIAFKNRNAMKYTYKYDLLPTIIINLIVTFAIPNISVIAHVGGLIIGIVCSQILCRKFVLK